MRDKIRWPACSSHVENGILEIFLTVCGSSASAPSCWVERRRSGFHQIVKLAAHAWEYIFGSSSPTRAPCVVV